MESASRWLVGSSSSSVCAPPNRIGASSMRGRWPPDRVRSCCLSPCGGRPRLDASDAASASAAYPPSTASRSSRWPYLRTAASRRAGSASAMPSSASRRLASSASRPRADSTRSMARPPRSPTSVSCGRYPTDPLLRTVPAAGADSPASTRASVVFPAPLRPTRPILSPGATWKVAACSSRRAPARNSRSFALITARTLHCPITGQKGHHGAHVTPSTGAAGHDRSGCMAPAYPSRRRGRQKAFPPRPSATAAQPAGRSADRRMWLGQPDPDRPEQPRRAAQDGQPGVGHGEEALHGKLEVLPQPRVVPQPGDRPPVSPEHHGIELAGELAEHRRRRVGRRPERLAGLLLPAPREALLRCSPGGAPAVYQPRTHLGGGQVRGGPGENPGPVAPEADQEHSDLSPAERMGTDPLGGVRGPGHLPGAFRQGRERHVALGHRPVGGAERHHGRSWLGGHAAAMALREGLQPVREALGADLHPSRAVSCAVWHYSPPPTAYYP